MKLRLIYFIFMKCGGCTYFFIIGEITPSSLLKITSVLIRPIEVIKLWTVHFLDTVLLDWFFYLEKKKKKNMVRCCFHLCWSNNLLFHQIYLFIAREGSLKEGEIQVCAWRMRICIYFWFQEKSNDSYIYALKDCILWQRESQKRLLEHYNFMPNCGAVKTKHNVFLSRI